MAEFPAIPFWTDAYIGDTMHLTTLQHGAYLLLLIAAWRSPDCSLPDDDVMLARITRMDKRTWKANRDTILAFWSRGSDAKLFQKRLKDERKYVEDKRNKNASAGKASALKRLNRGSTDVQQTGNITSTPTPTPTPIIEEGLSKDSPKKVREIPTRLPADFKPNDIDEAIARSLAFSQRDWDECLAEFRDYWAGVPGPRGKKLDWHATFRNSIRRYIRKGKPNYGTHQQKPSNLDNLRTAFDAIDARLSREIDLCEEDNT